MSSKKSKEKNNLVDYRINKLNLKFLDQVTKAKIQKKILGQENLDGIKKMLYDEVTNNEDLFNKTVVSALYNLLNNLKNTRIKEQTITKILLNKKLNIDKKFIDVYDEYNIYNEQLQEFNYNFNIKEIVTTNDLNYVITDDNKVVTYLSVNIDSSLNHLKDEDKEVYVSSFFRIALNLPERFTYFQINVPLSFEDKIKQVDERIEYFKTNPNNIKNENLNELLFALESDKDKLNMYQDIIKYQKVGIIAFTSDTLNEMVEMIDILKTESDCITLKMVDNKMLDYILNETVYANQYSKSSIAGTYSYDEYNQTYSKVLTLNMFETTQNEFYFRKIAEVYKELKNYNVKTLFSINAHRYSHDKSLSIVEEGLGEMGSRHKYDRTSQAEFEIYENSSYLSKFAFALRENSNETIIETETKLKVTGKSYRDVDLACKKAKKIIRGIGNTDFRKFDITSDLKKISHFSTPKKLDGAIQMPLSTFAVGFPYNYTIVDDPNGDFKNISYDEILNFNYFHKSNAALASSSGLIVGMSGSGKSTEMKETIKNHYLKNGITYTIDQDSEFISLTKALGGENIIFGESKHFINPFQLVKPDEHSELTQKDVIDNQVEFVSQIMITLYGDKYIKVKEKLENIVYRMYEEFGYSEFTFTEVLNEVKLEAKNQEKEIIEIDYLNLIEMIQNLQLKFDIFNHPTNVNLNRKLINFDISNVKENRTLLNTLMIVIFDFLNRKMTNNRINDKITDDEIKRNHIIDKIEKAIKDTKINYSSEELKNKQTKELEQIYYSVQPKILIMVDEAHRMFNNDMALDYLVKTVRESRKYETAIWFATQRFKDFFKEGLDDSKVTALYEQIPYKILLYQDKSSIDFVETKINLTESQKHALTQNGSTDPEKGVGLFVAGSKVYNFNNQILKPWLDIFKGGQ